jgi:UDP-2,4-diacetamido-2,4,6-trideoxy-beta-L-altropyranose hydrolase
MRVVIRADAASHIGAGHVMRCLTLANGLKERGAKVCFVCRPFPGHMEGHIVSKGHLLQMLPPATRIIKPEPDQLETPPHTNWLGESWETDLAQTHTVLGEQFFDWLIVDHYSLDSRWESAMRKFAHKVMVIDDLVDRSHDCELLLDQTFDRGKKEYKTRVPKNCVLLTGSNYALLGPEYAKLRDYSFKRRTKPKVEHLLISMGGIDQSNATGKVLESLQYSWLPNNCRITIVLGDNAPWLDKVREQAKKMTWPTELKVNVSNMAQLMTDSDLAIGTAGSTAWERCCLGLPAIMVVLADNQRKIGLVLEKEQAVILIKEISDVEKVVRLLCDSAEKLNDLSLASRNITDGAGVEKVVLYMEQLCVGN